MHGEAASARRTVGPERGAAAQDFHSLPVLITHVAIILKNEEMIELQ